MKQEGGSEVCKQQLSITHAFIGAQQSTTYLRVLCVPCAR